MYIAEIDEQSGTLDAIVLSYAEIYFEANTPY